MENLVGYAQRDLLTPLLTEAEVTGRLVTVAAANNAAGVWMGEVNNACHSEIAAVPTDRLENERALLAPLPSLRAKIGPDPVTRKVDRLSCIRFGSARYSVPNRMVGKTVWVIPDGARLDIVDAGTGELLADHALVAPGEVSVMDTHYDGPRKAPSRGARPRTTTGQRFCALGGVAEEFIVGAAAIGNTRLGSELDILLALAAAHGQEQFLHALRRAVAFKRFRAEDVRSILAAGTGSGTAAPTPVPAGGALVLELPTSATRDLSAYRIENYTDSQCAENNNTENYVDPAVEEFS